MSEPTMQTAAEMEAHLRPTIAALQAEVELVVEASKVLQARIEQLEQMVERIADEIGDEGMTNWARKIRAELRGVSDD